MPGVVRTKVIDHKRYNLTLSGITKDKARRSAVYARKHGGMARILPTDGKSKFTEGGGYDLWTRDTRR